MPSGRKPKPTVLKLLEGNRGKRPIPQDEPKPAKPVRTPPCPRWISPYARKEWTRIAKELHRLGLLTNLDVAVLISYCTAYGRLREAENKLKDQNSVVETSNGNLVQNPWIGIANRAMDQIRRFASELGLSPSARVRLEVRPEDPEMDLEELCK